MKALVTGVTGFVGQALASELARCSIDVCGIARRRGSSGIQAVHFCDLETETGWNAILDGVDVIVHLAGRAHVMRETAVDPLAAYRRANTEVTTRLAEAAARQGVRRFVFVSTIKVNGESTSEKPFRYDDPAAPADPYAISKWEAEQSLRMIAARTGMEVVIVRPPLVYGPGVKGNFARLAKWVNRGWPLPLGGCNNRRSLVGLGNLVQLLSLCVTHPAAANNTFLLSDGDDVSTAELVRRLADALGVHARLVNIPDPLIRFLARLAGKGGVYERVFGSLCVDITHTRETLGWAPANTMAAELKQVAVWLKAEGSGQ